MLASKASRRLSRAEEGFVGGRYASFLARCLAYNQLQSLNFCRLRAQNLGFRLGSDSLREREKNSLEEQLK
jgi:hypothetical protein